MISGILLAAGESSRMGEENKLLLPVEGEPMFKKALTAMQNSKIGELIVILGHDYKAMMPYFQSCSIRLAINGNHLEGQTSSIHTGLRMISPSSKAFLICLADMPFLTQKHIDDLLDAYENIDGEDVIMKPFNGDVPGNPVIFSKSFYDGMIACTDPDGCKSVIGENRNFLHKYQTTDMAYFRDIDTPQDYHNMGHTSFEANL